MALTALQTEVTKTSTFDGTGVDISALTKPFDVRMVVDNLTAGATAIFQLQTSTDSFSSDKRVEHVFRFYGPFSSVAPSGRVVHHYDLAGIRAGVTSAHMRLALTYIDGSSTVSYSANINN